MTANRVRADYEALTEITRSFDCQAENVRRILAQLHKDLDMLLDGDWVGRGSAEFYREMISDVLPSVKRLGDALERAARDTRQMSRVMKQAENECAALFKLDDTGVDAQAKAPGPAKPAGGERTREISDPPTPENPLAWMWPLVPHVPLLAWLLTLMSGDGAAPESPRYNPAVTITTPTPGATLPAPTAPPPPTAVPTQAAGGRTMYVSDPAGANLRPNPGTGNTPKILLNSGTALEVIGGPTGMIDNHVWYEVNANGQTGWVAGDLLSSDAPSGGSVAAPSSSSNLGFVNGAYVSGSTWLDTTFGLDTIHYGVDIASSTADNTLYSPYAGQVVIYDSCSGCPDGDGNTTTLGDQRAALEYNYGYGAMSIIEYSHNDLSEAQLATLREQGFDLQPGQSLYLMNAHQDRSGNNAVGGTQLKSGDAITAMGNSGNSAGGHFHIEAVINESGLRPAKDENTASFWLDTVAEYDYMIDKQGKRMDPTSLFVEKP